MLLCAGRQLERHIQVLALFGVHEGEVIGRDRRVGHLGDGRFIRTPGFIALALRFEDEPDHRPRSRRARIAFGHPLELGSRCVQSLLLYVELRQHRVARRESRIGRYCTAQSLLGFIALSGLVINPSSQRQQF